MPTDPTDLISTAEAAELLGVSVGTVCRMAETDRLVPVVRGRGIRGARFFHRSDVVAAANERREAILATVPPAATSGDAS